MTLTLLVIFIFKTIGVAISKPFAPSLANIFLIPFYHFTSNNFKIKLATFFKYIDTYHLFHLAWIIFFIWPGSAPELKEFKNVLNSWNPSIHLIFNYSPFSVNFLDLTVQTSPTTLMNTKIYFKPTDICLLL